MKLIVYKGIPDTVIAVAIAIQKKAKRLGRKITLQYEANTIIAKPKSVRVLYNTPPSHIVFNRIDRASAITAVVDGATYYLSSITGVVGDTGEAIKPRQRVAAVGGVALYDYLKLSVQPTAGYDYLDLNFSVDIVTKAKRLEVMRRDTFAGFVDEQAHMYSDVEAVCFIDKDSLLYKKGARIAVLQAPGMAGTDVNGDPVVVFRSAGNWGTIDWTQIDMYDIPNDLLSGGSHAVHYQEYYVAIPEHDYFRTLVGHEDYTDISTQVTNVGDEGLVLDSIDIEYTAGYDEEVITISQSFWVDRLAGLEEDESWRFVEYGLIPVDTIYPGSPRGIVTLYGDGYTYIDGSIAVSGVTVEIDIGGVNMPGVFTAHDAIAHYAGPEHMFSNANLSDVALFGGSASYNNGDPQVQVGTSTETSYGNYDINIDGYSWNRAAAFDRVVVSILHMTHVATGTRVLNSAASYDIDTVTNINTVSRNQYTLSYINGAFSVVDGPYAAPVSATPTTLSYVKDWVSTYKITTIYNPRSPTWYDSLLTATGAYNNNAARDDVLYVDGAGYIDHTPYTASQPINRTILTSYDRDSGLDAVYDETVTGPIAANRNAKPWWHQSSLNTVQARFAVRNGSSYTTVHGYIDSNDNYSEVYVDGIQICREDRSVEDNHGDTTREYPSALRMVPNGQHVEYANYSMSYTYNTWEVKVLIDPGIVWPTYQNTGGATRSGTSSTTKYMVEDPVYLLYGIADMNPHSDSDPQVERFSRNMPFPLNRELILSNDQYYWYDRGDYTYTEHGHTLTPYKWGAPRGITILHLKRVNYGIDGLCIFTHTITVDEFMALQHAYLVEEDEGVQDALFDEMAAHITVHYNNFASPELMALTAPGVKHVIYNNQAN